MDCSVSLSFDLEVRIGAKVPPSFEHQNEPEVQKEMLGQTVRQQHLTWKEVNSIFIAAFTFQEGFTGVGNIDL